MKIIMPQALQFLRQKEKTKKSPSNCCSGPCYFKEQCKESCGLSKMEAFLCLPMCMCGWVNKNRRKKKDRGSKREKEPSIWKKKIPQNKETSSCTIPKQCL